MRVLAQAAGTEAGATRPALPGLNIDGALARLGIGFDALKRMLIRFADGQAKTVADLRAAVDAGDAAAAARHAHALAGAAGNLGADTLREASKALEMAARGGGGGLADLAARVEELAAVVFRSIDTLRPPAAPQPSGRAGIRRAAGGSVDPEALKKAVQALQDALAAGDPDAAAAGLRRPVRAAAARRRARRRRPRPGAGGRLPVRRCEPGNRRAAGRDRRIEPRRSTERDRIEPV